MFQQDNYPKHSSQLRYYKIGWSKNRIEICKLNIQLMRCDYKIKEFRYKILSLLHLFFNVFSIENMTHILFLQPTKFF